MQCSLELLVVCSILCSIEVHFLVLTVVSADMCSEDAVLAPIGCACPSL